MPYPPIGHVRIYKRKDQGGYKASVKVDTKKGRRNYRSIPVTPALLDQYGPKNWREVLAAEKEKQTNNGTLRTLKITNKNTMSKNNKASGQAMLFATDRTPRVVKVMSDAEKIAAGYKYVQLDSKTRVLRSPEKL